MEIALPEEGSYLFFFCKKKVLKFPKALMKHSNALQYYYAINKSVTNTCLFCINLIHVLLIERNADTEKGPFMNFLQEIRIEIIN